MNRIRALRGASLLVLAATALGAPITCEASPLFKATANGVYRVEANGRRALVAKPLRGEVFADSTLQVSPNRLWALIDYLPANPGPGRVEELTMLISLRDGVQFGPEEFHKRYGAWLGELAQWDPKAPATIVIAGEKRVELR